MAKRLHLLTLSEQYRERQRRRSNRRLLFVAAFSAVCAFAAGYMSAPRAAEWHAVVHGASWHDGTRTERVTTTETRWVSVNDRRGHPGGKQPVQVPVTREREVPFNSRNWGLGLRAALSPEFGLQAGYYRNSYDRDTVYAVAEYTPLAWRALRAGGFAGLASGYQQRDVSAGAGLLLRLQGERASVTVRLMPKVVSAQSGTTVAVEAGWRL